MRFFFIFITVFIFYRPPAKNVMHKEKVHNFTRICYTPMPWAPTVDIATQSSRHSFKQVVVQTNCTQKFYTMLTKHSIKKLATTYILQQITSKQLSLLVEVTQTVLPASEVLIYKHIIQISWHDKNQRQRHLPDNHCTVPHDTGRTFLLTLKLWQKINDISIICDSTCTTFFSYNRRTNSP